MNNLYDILEICIQELENGADMDALLARYPSFAGELRPILKASVEARSMAQEPSPEAVRRGRAKLLQRASEMREAKFAPRKRVIPFFQRLAISFTMTALFLASGTGLVGASSTALPGENLYPVKLTWENVRLFFTFDHATREMLEHTFGNERLHEVSELLNEGRHETIQFSGIYMKVNDLHYVSGIQVAILDTTSLPVDELVNGVAVTVTGRTNAAGFVDAESIQLLPPGTVVPAGEPVEVDNHEQGNINMNGNDNGNLDENDNGNINEDVSANENENGNDNDNQNANENTNDDNNGNDDDNTDDGDNENEDGGGNDNGNSNDDGNDNGVDNSNDNVNENDNINDNDNTNDNVNDNTNDNVNDNTNENTNDNVNDDTNTNDDNSNDGDNTNDDNNNDDNSNDDNDNDDNNNNGKTTAALFGRVEEFRSRKYFPRA